MKPRILLTLEISDGRNKELIEALAATVASIGDVNLIEVSSNLTGNRTIYSCVGGPEALIEVTLSMARGVSQLVDMTVQKGAHCRLGSMDLCYFMPVSGVTLSQVIDCAQSCGLRLASDIRIPVYLVGAATYPGRETLAKQLLSAEYESLDNKLSDPSWAPDFGPAEFVPQWGASMVGARKFLVCYNVNLLATKEQATRLALNIHQEGRGEDEVLEGRTGDSHDPSRKATHKGAAAGAEGGGARGGLEAVQAIGWYSEEQNVAQVATKLADFEVTPLHMVYQRIKRDAEDLNLAVVGSQIVGMIPLRAVLLTADHFIEEENLFILEEDQKIRLVVQRLGLSSLLPFNSKERIIEHMLDDDPNLEGGGHLISLSVKDFVFTVGSRTITPGGGSVAALTAILGTSLAAMTGLLSYGTKRHEALDSVVRRLVPPLYSTMKSLLPCVDQAASLRYERAAFSEPEASNSLVEQNRKADLEQRVLQRCVMAPVSLARELSVLWPVVLELAQVCGLEHRSDLQVAVKSMEAGLWGAHYTLQDTIVSIEDQEAAAKAKTEMETYLKTGLQYSERALTILANRK